jgi:prephenate dehydratase
MFDRVAIQGEPGSFSDAAARKLLGDTTSIVACRTFDEVFEVVRAGSSQAAVVPIENSLAGSILRTYELLGDSGLGIFGETLLRISMNLIARPGARIADIRRVLSHPVARAHCQRFLAEHADIEAVAAYDTAGSVKLMMESGDVNHAAIAGRAAAELYGAEVIAANIQDHQENFTRFLLIAPAGSTQSLPLPARATPLKTTVLFRTPNKPGALFRALAAFALRDINLTKLESRPIAGRPWEYVFYADISGGSADPNVANALNHLREMCEQVVVLGSYASASEGIERREAEC